MKKWTAIAFLSLAFFGLGSCSKEDSTQSNQYIEDHRFFIQGEIGGEALKYTAGENDYYLETDYTFGDNILEANGTLAPNGQLEKNSIKLVFRSAELLSYESQFNVDSTLATGPVSFEDASAYKAKPGQFRLDFNFDPPSGLYVPTWEFPNGNTSNDQQPSILVNGMDDPVYPVSLKISSLYCTSTVTHHINVEEDCDATFNIVAVGNSALQLQPTRVQGELYSTEWFCNDKSISLDSNNRYAMDLYNTPRVSMKAVFKFKNGCEKIVEKEFSPDNVSTCSADFIVKKSKVKVHDPHQLGTVELIYFDDKGTEYSSYYHDVRGEFRILSSTPYKQNESGQSTTRFFFETDVTLRNAAGDSLHVKDAYGSFAIAHP